MGKKLGFAAAALLAASVAMPASAAIEDDLQNICLIVKNNDKSELRKKMRNIRREYSLRMGDYYTGIKCSDMSLLRYAMTNASHDVGEYIIKAMSRSDLQQKEADGLTIEQWADQNGHLKTPIGVALIDRLNTD
ncbi:hypothetical protein HMF8227_02905 [Saliniradius amylolyticus]|uniref:DUF3718 domain-containing protein n=1 Tax=Saliniradius amylolyticus TaxID=2183582 RepID=A0A2S2E6S4_9ALTE|nr:DUF3718 domain-containing protein [Saliniradius amylolyticus]AWL13353.1 hypothetical protein HMF8227_02905 [Saliniradius amylolyticus]